MLKKKYIYIFKSILLKFLILNLKKNNVKKT